jgi:hypothetical protein
LDLYCGCGSDDLRPSALAKFRRNNPSRMKRTSVIVILALATIYVAEYFSRTRYVNEPLVSYRVFKTHSESLFFASLFAIEDRVRLSLWGQEFLPDVQNSN